MSEETEKKSRRPSGAGALWIAVAVLGAVYVAAWSVDRTPQALPQHPASITEQPLADVPQAQKDALAALARDAATVRAPGATIQTISIKDAYFIPGAELRLGSKEVGQRGVVIELGAVRDGKLEERLTYHALSPNQVVFVSQEPAR